MQCSRLTPHASRKKVSRSLAFTISELLIALGIIGLIATFTVPKVLNGIDQTQKESVFKQTLGMLHTVLAEGYVDGNLEDCGFVNYFRDRLNYRKHCSTSSDTQGCWPPNGYEYRPHFEESKAGFVLHNGAMIYLRQIKLFEY